jgi:hypothetical protein
MQQCKISGKIYQSGSSILACIEQHSVQTGEGKFTMQQLIRAGVAEGIRSRGTSEGLVVFKNTGLFCLGFCGLEEESSGGVPWIRG